MPTHRSFLCKKCAVGDGLASLSESEESPLNKRKVRNVEIAILSFENEPFSKLRTVMDLRYIQVKKISGKYRRDGRLLKPCSVNSGKELDED